MDRTMALPQDIGNRISRALQDVRPETPFPGRQEPARSLAERMADCATPGVSFAVVDAVEVIWAQGFGTRTAGTGADVGASTPFQSGSISKAVFALAVMRLVERGQLDLDADVNGYLKSWQVPANEEWQPRITLRHLLSHTAGTTVHGFPGYPAGGPWPAVPQVLRGEPPANNPPVVVDLIPGTQFRYSGGGTTIAQQAVIDVTGKPFPALMRELILDPAGMADSTFEQPLPAAMVARAATGHAWNSQPIRGGWHVYPEMAAAGLWTTAGDLARLGAAVMRALRGDRSPLGLEQGTIEQMLRPQLSDEELGKDFCGLGWFCSGEGDAFRFGHGGHNEGFLADMKFLPAIGAGAIVMLNSIQGWPILGELVKAIDREFGWPGAEALPKAVTMPTGKNYAGLYRSPRGAAFQVKQTAQGLLLQFAQQPSIPLTPASDREFFATALDLRVTFERADAEGPVVMTVIQNDATMKLSRVDGQ
jgi:CubicO group peptidase (beta-lactamase class C family)